MQASELTALQVSILRRVYDDEGRTPIESIYELVEAQTPSPRAFPYRNARAELGTLEIVGLLDVDENTNWAMGAIVFTAAGNAMAAELFEE